MHKKQRRISVYACEVCKTEYTNKRQAMLCDDAPTIAPEWKVGDTVSNKDRRICNIRPKAYRVTGTVTQVIGPQLMDPEYGGKWLHGYGCGRHVYQFVVAYTCPICDREKTALYYAPELRAA